MVIPASSLLNAVTCHLPPYPTEELGRIKKRLWADQKAVYDFGAGDPHIPVDPALTQTLHDAIPQISQYPSIYGTKDLEAAHQYYLSTRFGIKDFSSLTLLPSKGSKEAIFHIALSLVGRAGGRRRILYPDPAYPVYKTSTLFAGGIPTPVRLSPEHNYLLKPWLLPKEITQDCAAVWVNYPHNPTGHMAPEAYWHELIAWCHKTNTILLSDECYVDIYAQTLAPHELPLSALQFSSDRVISFFSLSKRSGLTGYRLGFMAGDSNILLPHANARSSFGVAVPDYLQVMAAAAWRDERHVAERREIFSARMAVVNRLLQNLGLIDEPAKAAFYTWARVPKAWQGKDVDFVLALAQKGLISMPSSWVSEGITGYFRMAMVPSLDATYKAMEILASTQDRL